MIKLSTPVIIDNNRIRISLKDKIMVLGSCFSDEIGARLAAAGFDVCINPFGPLYNPLSIANAIGRLDSCNEFQADDCVMIGAGSSLICSHFHHTSFAREAQQEFLSNANGRLAEASEFWKSCNKVIITLGTAYVWRLAGSGTVVANCLKRPSCEFTHGIINVSDVSSTLQSIVDRFQDKEFIFTVSPIRHLGEGAHKNTISKATLQLGIDGIRASNSAYFPSFEIMMDELRDYRFYAEDMTHPSPLAVSVIWEKFLENCGNSQEFAQIKENEKKFKHLAHRPNR